MSAFQDKYGEIWTLDIKTSDVQRVKKLVKDRDGKPVDLLAMTERANFSAIKNDLETLVSVILVLCFEEINERFSVEQWDKKNEATYELIPEWRDEPRMKKAFRWLESRISCDNLPDAVEAFIDAMINFTPSLHRREALKKIEKAEEEMEKIACEKVLEQMTHAAEKMPEIMDAAAEKQMEAALTTLQETMENPPSTGSRKK